MCSIIIGLLILGFEIAVSVISFGINVSWGDYTSSNFISKNWNQRPILDIIINKNLTCPKNYERLYYGDSIGINPLYVPKSQFPLSNWKGIYFCLKYYNYTYNYLTIVNTTTSCPINMFSCGIIDTLENKLCVKANETCPINYIKITNDISGFNNTFKFQQYSQSNYLVTSNSFIDKTIILPFQFYQNRVCSYIKDIGVSSSFSIYSSYFIRYYDLNNCFNMFYSNGNYYDENPYFILFDSDKGINNPEIKPNLTSYSSYFGTLYRNNDFNLYYVPYFGINTTCEKIYLNSSNYDWDKVTSRLNLLLGIRVMSTLNAASKVFLIFEFCLEKQCYWIYLIYFFLLLIQNVLAWIYYVFIINFFPLSAISYNDKCFDFFTKLNLNDRFNYSSSLSSKALLMGILSTVAFVISVVGIIKMYCAKSDDNDCCD